ncbi:ER membrane protein complex subunit 1 [Armadillidium vulgare]|nr:ER membrane protein complex subunit 1 [Armadillidium vulgare]
MKTKSENLIGDILWRQILEEKDNGKIEVLSSHDHFVSVVIGNLIRTWDVHKASLEREVLLELRPDWNENILGYMFGFGINPEDLFMVSLSVGTVNVTSFDSLTGSVNYERRLSAPWLKSGSKCTISGDVLVCLDLISGNIYSLNLNSVNSAFISKPVISIGFNEVTKQEGAANPSMVSLNKIYGSESHFLVKIGSKKKLIHSHKDGLHLVKDLSDVQAVAFEEETLFTVSQSLRTLTLQAVDLSTGNEIGELGVVVELPLQSGAVQSLAIHSFTRKDGGTALRAFISCSDHSVHLISSAGVVWSREEALAQILTVEAVDLPIEGAATSFQDPISYDAGIVQSFLHRIKGQTLQVIGWLNSFLRRKDGFEITRHSITRDKFNTRKLMVVVTSSGKVTGEGLLLVFNPLTGEGLGENGGVIPLGYQILQASLLQHMDENYIKPLLIIDSNLRPHVYPRNGEMVVLQWKSSLYVTLAQPETSILKGYSLRDSKPGNLMLSEVWSLSLASSGSISGFYPKPMGEKVHSQGRVLPDRSVLYKYCNPNLAVVTTYRFDKVGTLTVYLIDTVTGTILESVIHKKVSGPFHVVHSENWIVYTSFNEKSRRYEVTSLELFEGLSQANVTAFSSFGAKATPPILERQAFIISQGVQAAAETTTEKGITTKFVIFALRSGNVLQMSKLFLDPRRPMTHGGFRDEHLPGYLPELPFSPQEMINHNHSLPRVSAIYTSFTGLESTCLMCFTPGSSRVKCSTF